MDYNERLTGLFAQVAGYKEEQPSAGRKFQLLALISETINMVALMKCEVLRRVGGELSLDIDSNIDFAEMAELLLQELPEPQADGSDDGRLAERLAERLAVTELNERVAAPLTEVCTHMMMAVDSMSMQQLTRIENEMLGELSSVLLLIADALDRPRKDEDYARLYEQELKRFNGSSTARTARKNYELWRNNECYGRPSLEDIDDYRLSMLICLFEQGVFDRKVARMQRGKHFPGEIDFSQMDDDHPLRKTINKHYAALRKMVDFKDGCLEPDVACVGRFFYASRHDANAKALRNMFMKYMLKIQLVQEERRRLLNQQAHAAETTGGKALNYFAPTVNLQELLRGEWFRELRCSETYDTAWTDRFISALMTSEWADEIARDWAATGVRNKRTQVKGYIVGLLKDAGVLKGSYDSIAREAGVIDDARLFARYMSDGKKQYYADRVKDYIAKG